MKLVTLDQFITSNQRQFPTATGEFSSLLASIATAAKFINSEIRSLGLKDLTGTTGVQNQSGDQVQKLDLLAHETFTRILGKNRHFSALTSEESTDLVLLPESSGKYIIHLDPIDGSGGIDVSFPVGSIFSIHKRLSTQGPPTLQDALQPGKNQVCAGYVLYGSSTILVYTTGQGVNGFTLDPHSENFVLSHPDLKFPASSLYYSTNEGYSNSWTPALINLVNHFKQQGKKLRYFGCIAAEFHLCLIKGGFYFYPTTKSKPHGNERLMFEANPIAFLAEQAGGLATDGNQNILDIQPQSIHQQTPLFLGSKSDILTLKTLLKKFG